MVYRGHIKKGVVILDDAADLSDGTEVTVRPIKEAAKKRLSATQKKLAKTPKSKSGKPWISPGLARLAGAAKNLPADAARNLDHYLYGAPKQK